MRSLPGWFHEQIGLLGWVELPVYPFVEGLWWTMIVGLLAAALVVGTRRQRIVLALLVVGDLFFTVLLGAVLQVESGLPMQARYVLPFNIIVVLLAGDIVRANHRKVGRALSWCAVVVAAAAAMGQALTLWQNSQRYAVGVNGPAFFVGRAAWTPPLGWEPWLLTAGVGLVLLIVGMIASYVGPGASVSGRSAAGLRPTA
jgi:hypothetical protein